MKKIVIVSEKLDFGGVTKVLLSLLNAFNYCKYEVTLFLPIEKGVFEPYINKNVIIKRYNRPDGTTSIKTVVKNYLKKINVVSAFKSVFYYCLAKLSKNNRCKNHHYFSKCFFPRIDNKKYDCCICFNGLMLSSLETASKVKAKKHLAWIHGIYWEKYKDINNFYYKKMEKIICVSQAAKESFINTFSAVDEKTIVIYNLFDKEEIITKSNEICDIDFIYPTLVTVGRLSEEKGQDLIPEIVFILKKRGIDCKWYIIGEGLLREKIEKEIHKFHVEQEVVLLGARKNPYPFIKNCDVYVQPSFSEGYCTSTMEAKILKKLIVTTDVPGMREQFVDGETAIIVSPTSEDLAEGIFLLLNSQELVDNLNNNLKDFNYSADIELNKIYSLIG